MYFASPLQVQVAINDLCLSLSACPSGNVPGNKLHFSLRAAAATLLLGETISLPQLHTLFKIFFFFSNSMHVFVRLTWRGREGGMNADHAKGCATLSGEKTTEKNVLHAL